MLHLLHNNSIYLQKITNLFLIHHLALHNISYYSLLSNLLSPKLHYHFSLQNNKSLYQFSACRQLSVHLHHNNKYYQPLQPILWILSALSKAMPLYRLNHFVSLFHLLYLLFLPLYYRSQFVCFHLSLIRLHFLQHQIHILFHQFHKFDFHSECPNLYQNNIYVLLHFAIQSSYSPVHQKNMFYHVFFSIQQLCFQIRHNNICILFLRSNLFSLSIQSFH